MKCPRCAAEVPAKAQFCMKCGAARASGTPGGAATVARPFISVAPSTAPNRKPLWIGIAVAALALAGAGIGWQLLSRSGKNAGARVIDSSGDALRGRSLSDRTGKVAMGNPLTDKDGAASPAPPDPADVIDYLKFLKEIERQRIATQRSNVSEALKQSSRLTAGNLIAEMSDNPDERHNQDYANFQASLSKIAADWQALSSRFLTKPAPQSCAALRDKYYDLLGKTNAAIGVVLNSMSKALGGDAGAALDALTGIEGSGAGSASKSVSEACIAADDELAAVCEKFKLRKDFDIRDDLGSGNLLGR